MTDFPIRPDGVVDRFFCAGPRVTELPDLGSIIKPDGSAFGRLGRGRIANAPLSLELKSLVYSRISDLLPRRAAPAAFADGVRVRPPSAGETAEDFGPWRVERIEEDFVADFSRFNFVPVLMEAVAYTGLSVSTGAEGHGPETTAALLYALGPVSLWVNGALVFHGTERFGYVEPFEVPLKLPLKAGFNSLLLYGAMVGWREARIALGLRVVGGPNRTSISLPLPEAWGPTEALLEEVGPRQFCFPDGIVRLKRSIDSTHPPRSIHAQLGLPHREEPVPLGRPSRVEAVTEQTFILAPGEEATLYVDPGALQGHPSHESLVLGLSTTDLPGLVLTRDVYVPRRDGRKPAPSGFEARQTEALEALTGIHGDIMSVLCGLRLDREDAATRNRRLDEALSVSLPFLDRRHDCADFHALALILAVYRFGGELGPTVVERIRRSLLGFKYWHDEPGVDAMCWFTENHQIIFHAAACLAGTLYPKAHFSSPGVDGAGLARRAAARALAWIRKRLRGGYSEWDSNTYLAMDVYALLAVVDFLPNTRLAEAARALLDKTFFMIACQSLRGVHGCSHGRCYVQGLKTGRVESTSALSRMAWGLGGFDGETWAAGMMALSAGYRPPGVIERIGRSEGALVETQASSFGRYTWKNDLKTGSWGVNTLTRKTRDYLLSAACDVRPGDVGIQEHLWQLTFSAEAVLFSTWPGNGQEHGNARPNYWAGSARLPKVTMSERTLACRYGFPPTAGLGFSHLYCPIEVFDEHRIEDEWVFVRHGGGYGAARSDGRLLLTRTGRHAYQELRSAGPGKTWTAVAGSAAEDGDFGAFVRACRGGEFEADAVRGDADFPHYRNCYTDTPVGARRMKISDEEGSIDLDLGA